MGDGDLERQLCVFHGLHLEQGLGFRAWGVRSGVRDLGFGVWALQFEVWGMDLVFGVLGLRFGLRVQGSGAWMSRIRASVRIKVNDFRAYG